MSSPSEPGPEAATGAQAKRELQTLRLVVMSAAHQLNNIMSGLLGYADLERNADDRSPLARTVIEQCDRGVVLCRALMSLAARSYGKTETVSPLMPLEDVLALVSKHLANKQVSVSRKCAPMPPCKLDVGAVRQAFLEALLYGSVVLPDGGTIEIDGQSDDAFAHVRLGMIPKRDAPRGSEAVPSSFDLSTAERVMAEHGGKFGVDECDGHSRRVSLSFPLPSQ